MDEPWKQYPERNNTQKLTHYITPFVWNIQNRQIHKDRKQSVDDQRLGGNQEMENDCLMDMGFILDDENVLELDISDGYAT